MDGYKVGQRSQATWEEECEAWEDRLNRLKELSGPLSAINITGGELDLLPEGYAASILAEVSGSVVCITSHSLTAEKAQALVYQITAQLIGFVYNETE